MFMVLRGVFTYMLAVKFTCGLPLWPFLVVMMITPLLAREPYIAVAEASFRMVMLSMFSGEIRPRALLEPFTVLPSMGTPSTTIRGALLAASDAPPRMRMLAPPAGLPPSVVTTTPGLAPTSRSWAVEARPASISSGFTTATEPVASLFFTMP